jgi:hypothetical protein
MAARAGETADGKATTGFVEIILAVMVAVMQMTL